MKKLIIILLFAFVFGCSGLPINIGQQSESKVCPPPEGVESYICDRSAELKITPETAYGWIFTGVAGSIVFADVDRLWICKFDKEVADWYVENYPISYDTVVSEMIKRTNLVDDPEKVLLLKRIVNKNLNLYASPSLIGEYDDKYIIRAGNNLFRKDLFCPKE